MLDATDPSDAERPFLRARWSNVCIVTFAVPPDRLEDEIPDSLELITRDGEAFVSLVALDFEETEVWGVGWPGFRNFPQINFRCYVTDGQRRGVSFLREFVPQPFVAWVAGIFFHEPYESTPIESEVARRDDHLTVERRWTYGGTTNRLTVEADDTSEPPDESTDAHFFTDHQWCFRADGTDKPPAYEARHPTWETYPVRSLDYTIDWSGLYGQTWDILDGREPTSVVLAEGSPVEMYSDRSSDDN